MPVKVVPPVLMAEKKSPSKHDIGPITVMSGFMTKKTRSFNRWKQRWWQLMDNGLLCYYKNDDHLKLLGQIDIARTCYDVRLGSDKCNVEFPRAAPSCCCISFTVLKRTYHLYTPTPGEAQKWYQAISTISRIINRKVIAGVERRKAPEPPCPSRPPSCPPDCQVRVTRVRACNGISDSCESITRIEYVKKKSPRAVKLSSLACRGRAISVPDCLDKIEDHELLSPLGDGTLDSRLWLDGSPPVQAQIHPQGQPTATGGSWLSPISSPAAADHFPYSSSRPHSPHHQQQRSERHRSLSSSGKFREDRRGSGAKPRRCVGSVGNITSCSPGRRPPPPPKPLARSKLLSRSMDCLITNAQPITLPPPPPPRRPVPKPRRGKARTSADAQTLSQAALELEPASTADVVVVSPSHSLLPTSPIRPRNNSEPAKKPRRSQPKSDVEEEEKEGASRSQMRPRNNSEPSKRHRRSTGEQKLATTRSKKSSSRRRGRIFSPPSTPPPAPPPLPLVQLPLPPTPPQPAQPNSDGPPTTPVSTLPTAQPNSDEPLTTPVSTANPKSDGPPTTPVSTLPTAQPNSDGPPTTLVSTLSTAKPVRCRDSGPPNFVPPPPPPTEELET